MTSETTAWQHGLKLPASVKTQGLGCFFALRVLTCVVLAHMLDATQLRTHVPCYATAFARTVRLLHRWCGGGGCFYL